MKIHSNNKETTIINPSIQNIIPLFQLSDVLCHTGYGFVIYDLVRNNEGNVIDVIIIEYGCGIGASYVSSKITRYIINTPSGEEFVSNLYSLFLSKKLNSDLKKGIEEGSIGIKKFSKYTSWVNMNITDKRKQEFTILRFAQKDSDGNAIFKYKENAFPNYKNNFSNYDIIHYFI